VDLQSLREAANLTTSSALHTFDCQSLIRRAYSQLALAIGSMMISLILLSMSNQVKSVAYGSSVALLAVAAIATCRYWATTRVLSEKLRPLR
jgi:hypothetical protein